jgi:hypothetical protein
MKSDILLHGHRSIDTVVGGGGGPAAAAAASVADEETPLLDKLLQQPATFGTKPRTQQQEQQQQEEQQQDEQQQQQQERQVVQRLVERRAQSRQLATYIMRDYHIKEDKLSIGYNELRLRRECPIKSKRSQIALRALLPGFEGAHEPVMGVTKRALQAVIKNFDITTCGFATNNLPQRFCLVEAMTMPTFMGLLAVSDEPQRRIDGKYILDYVHDAPEDLSDESRLRLPTSFLDEFGSTDYEDSYGGMLNFIDDQSKKDVPGYQFLLDTMNELMKADKPDTVIKIIKKRAPVDMQDQVKLHEFVRSLEAYLKKHEPESEFFSQKKMQLQVCLFTDGFRGLVRSLVQFNRVYRESCRKTGDLFNIFLGNFFAINPTFLSQLADPSVDVYAELKRIDVAVAKKVWFMELVPSHMRALVNFNHAYFGDSSVLSHDERMKAMPVKKDNVNEFKIIVHAFNQFEKKLAEIGLFVPPVCGIKLHQATNIHAELWRYLQVAARLVADNSLPKPAIMEFLSANKFVLINESYIPDPQHLLPQPVAMGRELAGYCDQKSRVINKWDVEITIDDVEYFTLDEENELVAGHGHDFDVPDQVSVRKMVETKRGVNFPVNKKLEVIERLMRQFIIKNAPDTAKLALPGSAVGQLIGRAIELLKLRESSIDKLTPVMLQAFVCLSYETEAVIEQRLVDYDSALVRLIDLSIAVTEEDGFEAVKKYDFAAVVETLFLSKESPFSPGFMPTLLQYVDMLTAVQGPGVPARADELLRLYQAVKAARDYFVSTKETELGMGGGSKGQLSIPSLAEKNLFVEGLKQQQWFYPASMPDELTRLMRRNFHFCKSEIHAASLFAVESAVMNADHSVSSAAAAAGGGGKGTEVGQVEELIHALFSITQTRDIRAMVTYELISTIFQGLIPVNFPVLHLDFSMRMIGAIEKLDAGMRFHLVNVHELAVNQVNKIMRAGSFSARNDILNDLVADTDKASACNAVSNYLLASKKELIDKIAGLFPKQTDVHSASQYAQLLKQIESAVDAIFCAPIPVHANAEAVFWRLCGVLQTYNHDFTGEFPLDALLETVHAISVSDIECIMHPGSGEDYLDSKLKFVLPVGLLAEKPVLECPVLTSGGVIKKYNDGLEALAGALRQLKVEISGSGILVGMVRGMVENILPVIDAEEDNSFQAVMTRLQEANDREKLHQAVVDLTIVERRLLAEVGLIRQFSPRFRPQITRVLQEMAPGISFEEFLRFMTDPVQLILEQVYSTSIRSRFAHAYLQLSVDQLFPKALCLGYGSQLANRTCVDVLDDLIKRTVHQLLVELKKEASAFSTLTDELYAMEQFAAIIHRVMEGCDDTGEGENIKQNLAAMLEQVHQQVFASDANGDGQVLLQVMPLVTAVIQCATANENINPEFSLVECLSELSALGQVMDPVTSFLAIIQQKEGDERVDHQLVIAFVKACQVISQLEGETLARFRDLASRISYSSTQSLCNALLTACAGGNAAAERVSVIFDFADKLLTEEVSSSSLRNPALLFERVMANSSVINDVDCLQTLCVAQESHLFIHTTCASSAMVDLGVDELNSLFTMVGYLGLFHKSFARDCLNATKAGGIVHALINGTEGYTVNASRLVHRICDYLRDDGIDSGKKGEGLVLFLYDILAYATQIDPGLSLYASRWSRDNPKQYRQARSEVVCRGTAIATQMIHRSESETPKALLMNLINQATARQGRLERMRLVEFNESLLEVSRQCTGLCESRSAVAGDATHSTLPAVLAHVIEYYRRQTGLYPRENQFYVMAEMVLNEGYNLGFNINTGQGKTIISHLMAITLFLSGKNPWIATSNSPLAEETRQSLCQVIAPLLSLVPHGMVIGLAEYLGLSREQRAESRYVVVAVTREINLACAKGEIEAVDCMLVDEADSAFYDPDAVITKAIRNPFPKELFEISLHFPHYIDEKLRSYLGRVSSGVSFAGGALSVHCQTHQAASDLSVELDSKNDRSFCQFIQETGQGFRVDLCFSKAQLVNHFIEFVNQFVEEKTNDKTVAATKREAYLRLKGRVNRECDLIKIDGQAAADGYALDVVMILKLLEATFQVHAVERGKHYTVTPQGIRLYNTEGSIQDKNQSFSPLVHALISVREGLESLYTVTKAALGPTGFMDRARRLIGFSGTMVVNSRFPRMIRVSPNEADIRKWQFSVVRNVGAQAAKIVRVKGAKLVFCVSTAAAQAMKDELNAKGLSAYCVVENDPDVARDEICIAEAKARLLSGGCVVSTGILGRGFDIKGVVLHAFITDPDLTESMYIQMAGRAGRQGVEGFIYECYAKEEASCFLDKYVVPGRVSKKTVRAAMRNRQRAEQQRADSVQLTLYALNGLVEAIILSQASTGGGGAAISQSGLLDSIQQEYQLFRTCFTGDVEVLHDASADAGGGGGKSTHEPGKHQTLLNFIDYILGKYRVSHRGQVFHCLSEYINHYLDDKPVKGWAVKASDADTRIPLLQIIRRNLMARQFGSVELSIHGIEGQLRKFPSVNEWLDKARITRQQSQSGAGLFYQLIQIEKRLGIFSVQNTQDKLFLRVATAYVAVYLRKTPSKNQGLFIQITNDCAFFSFPATENEVDKPGLMQQLVDSISRVVQDELEAGSELMQKTMQFLEAVKQRLDELRDNLGEHSQVGKICLEKALVNIFAGFSELTLASKLGIYAGEFPAEQPPVPDYIPDPD